MGYTKILFEEKQGIGILTLNDPKNLNTMLGNPMIAEIEDCIDACAANPDVKAIIIKGAGSCFSAGGDVKIMKQTCETGLLDYGEEARSGGRMILKLREIRKPVIASTHGLCVGGGLTIALGCDFLITADDCTFMVAFANVGLVPDMGATYLLTKILGPTKATSLMMTAKPFRGTDAYAWGLADQVVPIVQLEEATWKLAKKLANGPVLAYADIKNLVNDCAYAGLKKQIDTEADYQRQIGSSKDHYEAVNAFIEKRKANFQGN